MANEKYLWKIIRRAADNFSKIQNLSQTIIRSYIFSFSNFRKKEVF